MSRLVACSARRLPMSGVAGADPAQLAVYADLISQALAGERVGMLNYAEIAALGRTEAERREALAHARSEQGHASAFRALAQELGVRLVEDPAAPYWRRVREASERAAAAGDLLACTLVQQILLEPVAAALYRAVAEVGEQRVASTFAAIADDEQAHIDHGLAALRPALLADREGFEALLGRLWSEVMGPLAQMLAPLDTRGPCGLCARGCVKEALRCVGLEAATLRGRALRAALQTVDRLGVRGDRSLRWLASLPA